MNANTIERLIQTLTVPAAEYVPAISDALLILEEARGARDAGRVDESRNLHANRVDESAILHKHAAIAREAGLSVDGERVWSGYLDYVELAGLARFAALVRAAVLEEAARVCELRAAAYVEEAALTKDLPGAHPDDWRLAVYAKHVRRAAQDIRALARQAGGKD